MSRQERAEQLNEMVQTEQGLNEIVATYERLCGDAEAHGEDPGLTHALMIDAILMAEYPPEPPGFLAGSAPASATGK
jgi:hypothetical protein